MAFQKTPQKEEHTRAKELVRIASTDILGDLSVFAGLTKIKGISWSFSNAICKSLNLEKTKKISALSEQEIKRILDFIKNSNLPQWILNRRKDYETGENKHLIVTDLDLQREFDVRRLKRIRSYKGIRHSLGLPVRGQRTKAHFRKGKAIGVQKAKVKPSTKQVAKK